MRRPLALAALTGCLLLVSACGSDAAPLDDDAVAACQGYQELLSQWSVDYGAELGAVGEAVAAGDEQRRDTAVAVVRDLFADIATGMRDQAGRTSHEQLSDALADAATGLDEISGRIESYDDVTAAPDMMSSGTFAAAGERASSICAR